jgi:Autographiviridae endonuclease VII
MSNIVAQDLHCNEKRCTICGKVKPLSAFYPTSNKERLQGKFLESECKQCIPERKKQKPPRQEPQNTKRNPQDSILMAKYNINYADYQAMHEAQKGLCASCGQPETAKSTRTNETANLCVDHCHTFEIVRGLLCVRCNMALGLLNEDPERIDALAKYIRAYRETIDKLR